MMPNISRRACIGSAGLAAVFPTRLLARQPQSAPATPDSFPSQELGTVREMVGASHGNLERVVALLKEAPRLANAAYDWGFGDWETALGAASHTGRRQIAALLLEHGARPDIFAHAMLGHLDAVKAIVAAQPGIQRTRGPHGLTLLHHAKAGGEQNGAVVEYLAALGDADIAYQDLPLTDEERGACAGEYAFGPADSQRLRVLVGEKDRNLSIQRDGRAARRLFHQGSLSFHPAGAPEVRITFTLDGGQATSLAITSPSPVLTARRL